MNKEIYQDSLRIIGKIEKLDGLRVSRTGLPSVYFTISIPNDRAIQPILIPCNIYSKNAEDFEKKQLAGTIKVGSFIEVVGTHMNKNMGSHISLQIKVKTFEVIEKDKNLFGES